MLQPSPLHEPENLNLLNPEQAFLTDDSTAILRFAVDALTAGMATALVTLVEICGGAARPVGAQMAVREDGLYCGFVSGGCVESAAAYEAMEVIVSGEDRTVIYGAGSPYFDIVLPCGGGITLSIHKLRSVQPLLAVLNALQQRRPAGLRYLPQRQSLQAISSQRGTGWNDTAFEVSYRPCARIMIYGRSPEAESTTRIAQAAGYDVHAIDSANSRACGLIDADTAVILLYHDFDRELPVLEAALSAKPFYIGAIGSRRTHSKRVQQLSARGWSMQEINRIKAPIGIFPKARDARSLALSVLADVEAAGLHSPDKERSG